MVKRICWHRAFLPAVALALPALIVVSVKFLLKEKEPFVSSLPLFEIAIAVLTCIWFVVALLLFREVENFLRTNKVIQARKRDANGKNGNARAVAGMDGGSNNSVRDVRIHGARLKIIEEKVAGVLDKVKLHQQNAIMDKAGAAALAEEIRTSMNVVLGMSELLLASTIRSEHKDQVQNICTAARMLLAKVDGCPNDAMQNAPEEVRRRAAPIQPAGKVLVVDDNQLNLCVARGLMQLEGVECETAMSAREALLKMESREYSLVFMDYTMPEMNGAEATRLIRKKFRGNNRVPVIILTADNSPETKAVCTASGMSDFMVKPLDRDKLRRALNVWMNGKPDPLRRTPPLFAPGTPAPSRLLDRVGGIGGVNMEAAIEMLGGTVENYAAVLQVADKAIPGIIATLRHSLAKGDGKRVGIELHGLKSSLSSLGASALAGRAALLEKKNALSGSAAKCELVIFLDDLQDFSDKLHLALKDH